MDDRSARWDDSQLRNFDVVSDGSILSHLGVMRAGQATFDELPKWRALPERPIEVDISMVEGALTTEELVRVVRRRPQSTRSRKRDCARYFRPADVMNAGYWPLRTPSRGNPNHVSCYGNMDMIMQRTGTKFADALNDHAAHRWWWSLPGRVTLESIEFARRLP